MEPLSCRDVSLKPPAFSRTDSQRRSFAKELNAWSLHLSRHFDGNFTVDLFSGRVDGIMIKTEVKKAEHEKRKERKDPLLTEREALHLARCLFIRLTPETPVL